MHSSSELSSDMFHIEVDGKPITSFHELIPGFNPQDRLGVVVRDCTDGIWVSGLLMATITAFYAEQRKQGSDFFVYPDYFIFHAGCAAGDYGMLDVWPSHKSVPVADSGEEILRAVNDRAITILVVPQTSPRNHPLERQTRSSAVARLRQALLYAPASRADRADVSVASNPPVESYVAQVIERTPGLTPPQRESLRQQRQAWCVDGQATEWYRRIAPADALHYV